MFRRFRAKIRVYGNRRHGCSFKATINFLIWNDVVLVGLQNCYLGFSKFWKFLKIFKIFNNFFSFSKFPPSKSKFSKNRSICSRAMADEYVYKISSRYLQKWLRYDIKHVKNRHFSRHFGTLPWFSEFYFLTDFDASKSVLGSFFAFFAKIWPKNMYRSSKSRIFFAWPFLPGDLTWPWPLLWSWSTVKDAYKCQRHYPCRLVGFVCA